MSRSTLSERDGSVSLRGAASVVRIALLSRGVKETYFCTIIQVILVCSLLLISTVNLLNMVVDFYRRTSFSLTDRKSSYKSLEEEKRRKRWPERRSTQDRRKSRRAWGPDLHLNPFRPKCHSCLRR